MTGTVTSGDPGRLDEVALIDCDNHFYEARDAFTKHLPKEFRHRAVTPVRLLDGTEVVLAGDKLVTCMELPLDAAYRPGSLKEMLRQMSSGDPDEQYEFLPMQPEFIEREARLAAMDRQNVQAAIMYPGGWALTAENYIGEVDELYANLTSFNTWSAETWGWGSDGRILTPAVLSLRDLDRAVAELERVLDEGCRIVMLPTGPAYGRTPSNPYFDPFWSRVHDAGAVVAFHITEAFYNKTIAPMWGFPPGPAHFRMSAWQWQNCYGERPITETLSALIFDNLFGRYPNLKCVVSEFGAEWVPHFVRHLDKSRGMGRNGPWPGGRLTERPSEIFRRHIRVVPYPEDDIPEIVDRLGHVDSLVMGSDWPHAEGLAEPRQFADLVSSLSPDEQRRILRTNAQEMLGL